jgi:two-component system, chemotaxis family, protein-glutamate methylesterase/glutaminase
MINAERRPRDLVVIGASAGGVEALTILLTKLPADLPAAVAVVLHRSPYYESRLPAVLGRRATLDVREPGHGERVEPGRVYVAPRDLHMVLNDGRLELHRGPKEHYTRPAIDPLFATAARAYGARVVGVQLTGSGDDGVAGLLAIKAGGGISIAQDPSEAAFPAMPLNAMLFDHVEAVLPLEGIADALVTLASGGVLEVAAVKTSPR